MKTVSCDSCGAPGCDPECDRCGCDKIICSSCMDDDRLWHFRGGAHKLAKDLPAVQGYVVGFLFDPSFHRVVLIRKTKPLWQAGKWNGVGGKIETGETPYGAMLREFKEEAGMLVADWKEYCVLTGVEFRDNKRIAQNYSVHFFVSVNNWIDQAKTQGEERIEAWTVGDVGRVIPTVYHLTWLIPMAISHWRLQDAPAFEVTEVNR